MSPSAATAIGAATPSTPPTATLEFARKLRIQVATGREMEVETAGAAALLLGKRNNQGYPLAQSWPHRWSTMSRCITTVNCMMMTIVIMQIIMTTVMTIIEISTMMIMRFSHATITVIWTAVTHEASDRVNRPISIRRGSLVYNIRTTRARLSWPVISQRLSGFCKRTSRTPSPLRCRPTARCGPSC